MKRNKSYEEALKYDIYEAIERKAEEKFDWYNFSYERRREFEQSFPASLAHHPLLIDEVWLYDNIELIIVNEAFKYQKNQGPLEYYMFFKVLTSKYSVDEDYNKYCDGNGFSLKHKWIRFASRLINFINCAPAFKGVLDYLFSKSDFVEYFFRYPFLYDHNLLETFSCDAISKLLNYPNFASYYLANPNRFIHLLREKEKLKLPPMFLEDDRLLSLAKTVNVETFYFNMSLLQEKSTCLRLIEKHQLFCDGL